MANISELRGRRDELVKQTRALHDKTPAKDRMPESDVEKITQLADEIDALDARIKANLRFDLQGGEPTQEQILNEFTRDSGKQTNQKLNAAMNKFFRNGLQSLSGSELAEMRRNPQGPDIQGAMSTTTNTEGGFAVAQEYYDGVIAQMKAFDGIRENCTTINTGSGATLNYPTGDYTNEVGEIVGQNTTVTTLDTVFGMKTLDTFMWSSKDIVVPLQLIQDSMFDMVGYVNTVLPMRIGRIQADKFTKGAGTTEPFGLITEAGTGKVGLTTQTTSVLYDDIIDLEHSVDVAYRQSESVCFMMHDLSLRNVRKIKDTQNRPIFVPGYESLLPGLSGSAPATLIGRKIIINNNMPVMAANAKSIAFGAFSKYIIRDVMGLTMYRFADSAYARKFQVAFLGGMRSGGRLLDASAVKVYQNSAT